MPAPPPQAARPRPPWLSLGALACALLALPSAWVGARLFVWREDLLGWYGVVAGGLTMTTVLLLGVVLGGFAVRRGERPRPLPLLALVTNLGGLGFVLVAVLRAGGW